MVIQVLVLIAYFLAIIFLVLISNFMRFHLKLVVNNNTTLEYLDSKRKDKSITRRYDMNTSINWQQIFGKNKCLWLLPIESRGEEYDGINYPRDDHNLGLN